MNREIENHHWQELRNYTPEKMQLAKQALQEVKTGHKVLDVLRRFPLPGGGYMGKHLLVAAYREMVDQGEIEADPKLLKRIRMKPVRTLSGVTTVTVLTKPYPCPGKCIFCPTDIRMPKSYLPDEPGARRGLAHDFEPFEQVKGRIQALQAIGHPADKIELLILGGTWSAYRRDYQEWFVKRCLDAMNEADSQDLAHAQMINETAVHRNVGLVIETRPDHVDDNELVWLRRLGVTKVQIGAQSLDDRILEINHRGHSVEDTHRAVRLLRAAGFKIVLHWMPNLLGATPESDRADFSRLWEGLCPDEIKIYPNQLLENADLYHYWLRGEYHPYTTQELIDLIADIKPEIPRYCRVNRVIRDIPSTNVVEGNKRTSLRQDVQSELKHRGNFCQCIRCREVRDGHINPDQITLDKLVYQADGSQEVFLSFVTTDDRLAGFLRLSLPDNHDISSCLPDLDGAAVIREVHVYGQSLAVGDDANGAAQHAGLGTRLIRLAEEVALSNGYHRLVVISAIGTRQYYLDRGFERGEYYLVKALAENPGQ